MTEREVYVAKDSQSVWFGSRHANGRRSSTDGFTLVELLVCIAIVGLLAAILYSSLAPARERASQTRCMSNFHQIHLALQMYRQDCGGEDPPAALTVPELGLPVQLGAFVRHVGNPEIFQCRSVYYPVPRKMWPLIHYNVAFSQGENSPSASLPQFSQMVAKRGMDTVLFIDHHHGTFWDRNSTDPNTKVLFLRLNGQAEAKIVSKSTREWDY